MSFRNRLAISVPAAPFLLFLVASAEEKVLVQKTSPFNTIIVTENERGLRTLLFERGGARQSVVKVGDPDHLELPYARVMPVGLAFVDQPQRALIVGLGGGTVPSFLHKHLPLLELDVVELDPGVVEVAKEYFGFREDDKMHAFVEDGRKFIERHPKRYDIIFLDAFGADNVPLSLTTREFLQAVRASLKAGGVVVGNVWSRASNPLYDAMVRTYQDVFGEVFIFEVQAVSNRILVAVPVAQRFNKEGLARRARELSTQQQFGYDLGELVTYGFRDASKEAIQGHVLRDRDLLRK